MRIYTFFDVDGTSITVREMYRTRFPTHDEIRALVIHCAPVSKCEDFIYKEITIMAAELEDFIFSKIEIPRPFFKKDEIYMVSGTLKPHEGYFMFVFGLPYPTLIKRLNVEDKEAYYRRLYLLARTEMSKVLEKLNEEVEHTIKTASSVGESCKEIVKKYNDLFIRMFGFVAKGPEALTAAEASLTMVEQALAATTAPKAAAAPTAAPSKRAIERVRTIVSKLIGFVKGLIARLRGRKR